MKAFATNENLAITAAQCPSCGRLIVTIERLEPVPSGGLVARAEHVVWPMSSGRAPAPTEVPRDLARDFDEAALVLPFSAKASAALSRRCLQALLCSAAGAKAKDLSAQIGEVLPTLLSYIAQNLDTIRQIGDFAAHQQKSKATGEILDVEPGEAEWNLDVLDALFDFFYVRPTAERIKREQLSLKLQEAGKLPLKGPDKCDPPPAKGSA